MNYKRFDVKWIHYTFRSSLPKVLWKIRSSYQRCSLQKGVLRDFTKFTGKQLCQSLFCKKETQTLAQMFSCELKKTSGRLLLKNVSFDFLGNSQRNYVYCVSCKVLHKKTRLRTLFWLFSRNCQSIYFWAHL